MSDQIVDPNADLTVPPVSTLRCTTPSELYATVPQIANFTKHSPAEDEDNYDYFERLKYSTTPEDAVTFAAFAAETKIAIHWGMQSVHAILPEPGPEDRPLLSAIAQWMQYSRNENRWQVLQLALFARRRTPLVYLGLAVGWSGGMIAPNDPSRPPLWRSPSAINAALLTSVAQAGADRRSVNMAHILDFPAAFFRVH